MSTIRAFIAIKIPATIQEKLLGIQEKLKKADAGVTWVKSESIHLTLQFLGNIDETQIPEIVAQMRETVKTVSPFHLQIGYAGAFPNLHYPRVIWIGVTDDENGSLKTLEGALSSRMTTLGFESEEGRFSPHLTIGRVKSQKNKSNLLRAVEGMTNVWLGEIDVDTVYLIKSELRSTGAEYTDIEAVNI